MTEADEKKIQRIFNFIFNQSERLYRTGCISYRRKIGILIIWQREGILKAILIHL